MRSNNVESWQGEIEPLPPDKARAVTGNASGEARDRQPPGQQTSDSATRPTEESE